MGTELAIKSVMGTITPPPFAAAEQRTRVAIAELLARLAPGTEGFE